MENIKPDLKDKSWPMFPLDAQIHTEPLRVCKSLIPYLSFEKQKNISIFIKIFELMSVVDYYSQDKNLDIHRTSIKEGDNWQKDILQSVRNSLDPNHAFLIDTIFKFEDIKKIMSLVQSDNKDPKSNTDKANKTDTSKDFIDNISPMLDDNQKKILNMFSNMMD